MNPHLVGGWEHPGALEPPVRPDGRRDFRRLAGLLELPLAVLGDWALELPVWHVTIRAAPDDPDLGDGAWMAIAAEVMHRTGLSEHGHEDEGVRWVAVHHGDNHIHIAAVLARQDGRRAHLHNDYYRIGEALRDIEAEYGLVAVARADRTAARRPTRAENENAARAEPEFFAALGQLGCWSGSGPAPARGCPGRRPGTRSACPAWSTPGTGSRSGTAARPCPASWP